MVYGLSAASVAKRINTEGQAAQLLAIMQARLRSLASSASGHERMVNARAASGEKTIDFSEQIARFGDILKEWGRSSRSGPVCSLANRPLVRGSIPPSVGSGARGVGRENSGGHCGPTSFSTVDGEADGSLMSQR